MGIMERQRVLDEVIKPMEELYGEIPGAWRGIYVEGLECYSKEILKRAWKEIVVTRTYRTRPVVGEIREQCEKFVKEKASVSFKNSTNTRSEAIEAEIQSLMKQATEKFSNSSQAIDSQRQKWWKGDFGFKNYGHAHIWFQAQIVSGLHNFGYPAQYWGWTTWHKVTAHKVHSEMSEEKKLTIQNGFIEIIVPEHAKEWLKSWSLRDTVDIPVEIKSSFEGIKTLADVLPALDF